MLRRIWNGILPEYYGFGCRVRFLVLLVAVAFGVLAYVAGCLAKLLGL